MTQKEIITRPIKQGYKYLYRYLPLHWRTPEVFSKTYDLLKESQWWDKEKLEEYQQIQLQTFLQHANTNVPYYTRIINERGMKPEDIKTKADLVQLRFLTKKLIRDNFPDLVAKNIFHKELYKVETSGSSVSPLSFYW